MPSDSPQQVSLTVTSATTMSVSWQQVPPIHRNGIILTYELTYNPLEDYHDRTPIVLNTTDLTFDLTDLDKYANYTVEVRAYTEVGSGPYSEQQYARTDTAG